MADTWREADLRKEYIDSAVKAVSKEQATLKTLCITDTSSAWTESYYRETNDDSTDGGTYSPIKGIPQMAPFPFVQVKETKVSGVVLKFGDESIISLEMQNRATVPMLSRHILRMARKINYQINVHIIDIMDTAGVNTFAITAGNEWDSATVANRDPVYDFLYGINMMRADGIDALGGNGYIVMNGTDYTNVISNSKILNHPTFKSVSAVQNGVVNELVGLKIMVNEAVPADEAYIVVKGESLVWKEQQAQRVETIEDPGKSTTIRAWEFGVCQLHVPNGICKITNTRA
jgi:hypothetical protein